MTLLFRLPRLLGTLGIVCVCAAPTAYAAELEGTPVPLDHPAPVPVHVEPSVPEVAPVPPADLDEPQSLQQEHGDYAREQEDYAREQAEHAREQAQQAQEAAAQVHDHQDWEHNWERNLSQVFEDGKVDENTANLALLIPILAILFIFGGPIILLILILVFFFGSRRRRQRDMNNNIDKLLAAGRDIPIELLRGDEPKSADDSGNQAKGIRNICLGAGWLLFLTIAFNIKIGAIGFIWIGLGLSQVLIWYLNRPSAATTAGTTIDMQAGQQD